MTKEHKKHTTHTAHKKVMDVTRPGKAPASPTSRPVISNSKPPVADDQFVPSAPPLRASDPSAKHDLMDSKKRKELQPLDGAATPAMPESAPEMPVEAPVETFAETPTETPVPEVTSAPNINSVNSAPVVDMSVSDSLAAEPNAVTDTVGTAPAVEGQPAVQEQEAPTDADSAARLALGQTVEANKDSATAQNNNPTANPVSSENHNLPIWEHPDTSEQVEPSSASRTTATEARTNKSIEDLLAETGAPTLEPEQSPSMIVSHHHNHNHKWWEPILIFLLIVIIAAIVVDVLLDMEIIKTSLSLPHTDLL